MNRDMMQGLREWKANARRKPLLLEGARQVGKTWLLREFGRTDFANTAYVKFDGNPALNDIFAHGYRIPEILRELGLYTGEKITPGETLLVLDEIQNCPAALTSLKYFCENMPEIAVAAAGSHLGLMVPVGTGFPVGKVAIRHLYPLTFLEYLDAVGQSAMRQVIEGGDLRMMSGFSYQIIRHLKDYCFVGGMPGTVAEFVKRHDYAAARQVQDHILDTYTMYFSEHADAHKLGTLLTLFRAIPSQLSKENKRLVFGQVRKSARRRDFEYALFWLEQAGLVTIVRKLTTPSLPLSAYGVEGGRPALKLYLLDVGLLGAMAGLNARTILDGNQIFEEYNGALTEQYVCQQLVSGCGVHPFYWSHGANGAQVDFVVQKDMIIYGIEVKAAENLRSKSLKSFHDRFPETREVRLSLSDYRQQDWMVNVPLYAVQNQSLWNPTPGESK